MPDEDGTLKDWVEERDYVALLKTCDGLFEQNETADRALRAIHFNAMSWHAGEDGCRRALNVIGAWALHPESVPEGVGESSFPAESHD